MTASASGSSSGFAGSAGQTPAGADAARMPLAEPCGEAARGVVAGISILVSGTTWATAGSARSAAAWAAVTVTDSALAAA